jgi:fibronectin type 3 domain-containing protein
VGPAAQPAGHESPPPATAAELKGRPASTAKPEPSAAPEVEAKVEPKAPPERRLEHLRLACEVARTESGRGIACKWSSSEHRAFAAYRLWRGGDGERTVVFRSEQRAVTRYLDAAVEAGTGYLYVVEAVNADGQTIGRSDPVKVGFRDEPERIEQLRLDCKPTAANAGPGIACVWSESHHPKATGYRLVRSVDGGERTVVHRSTVGAPTRFVDVDVEAGHTYVYAVVAVAGDEVVGRAGPVKVGLRPSA